MMRPSLTIFDDQFLYIDVLSKLLAQNKIFDSIEVFNTYHELFERLKKNPPHFLILSTSNLIFTQIYDTIKAITSNHKNIKIIVIGNLHTITEIKKIFDKGIKSYLDRRCTYAELLNAIEALLSNEIYISNYIREKINNFINTQESENKIPISLTKRETEVLSLICNGFNSRSISEKLFISINTVESHRKNIFLKLEVKNMAGVIKYALENQIIK